MLGFFPQVHITIHTLGAAVGGSIALICLRNRDRLGALSLGVMMSVATLWMTAETLGLLSTTIADKLLFSRLQLVLVPLAVLAWLWFALEYTGNREWLTRRVVALLFVEPLAFYAVLFTRDMSPLVRTDPVLVPTHGILVLDYASGPILQTHILYSMLVWGFGTVLLFRMALTTDRLYRSQSFAVIIAGAAPAVASLLWVTDISPPGIETGVGIVVTGAVLAAAIFREQLLEYFPVARELARETLIEEIPDSVFLLDRAGRVVDLNPAAKQLCDADADAVIGQHIGVVVPGLESLADAESGLSSSPVELEIDGVTEYYDVQVSDVRRGKGSISGTLISLRDVTDQYRREQRLDVLTRVLRHNVRNEMSSVIGFANYIEEQSDDPDVRNAARHILEGSWALNDLSEKARDIAEVLDHQRNRRVAHDIGELVTQTTESLRKDYPDVSFTRTILENEGVIAVESLPMALEQALEACCKHEDVPNPSVSVTVDSTERGDTKWTRIVLEGDGQGIPESDIDALERGYETALEHGSGLGLWLTKWIIDISGGEIEFPSGRGNDTIEIYLRQLTDAYDVQSSQSLSEVER
jgi:PAS domain S-box-containing protein